MGQEVRKRRIRQCDREGGFDQGMSMCVCKCHNEAHYVIQLIYTNDNKSQKFLYAYIYIYIYIYMHVYIFVSLKSNLKL
jgi:hypothetical protein